MKNLNDPKNKQSVNQISQLINNIDGNPKPFRIIDDDYYYDQPSDFDEFGEDVTLKINDGHYTELMDRLYITTANIEDYLLSHPLTLNDDELENLIKNALNNLLEAYQYLGKTKIK